MRKRYNTPHRSRVVKTRMTEEEYAEFAERLSAYNMSQAEFIRQAITCLLYTSQKNAKAKAAYRQKYESDFIIADAAARYFRENGISKLPSYKSCLLYTSRCV